MIGVQAKASLKGSEVTPPAAMRSGRMFKPLPKLPVGVQDGLLVVVFSTGHGEVEGEHAARIESGRNILQARETSNEKSCADQQDHRERQFRNHEQAAEDCCRVPRPRSFRPSHGSHLSKSSSDRALKRAAPGTRPKRIPEKTESSMVNSSTRPSIPTSCSRGMLFVPKNVDPLAR